MIRLAVWWLKRMLKKDAGYYISWQSNIAMCMYDELKKVYRPVTQKNGENIVNGLCNKGAKRFLDLLISQ